MYSGVRCMTVFCRMGFWLCASVIAGLAAVIANFFKPSVSFDTFATFFFGSSLTGASLGGSSGARALHL